jgi:vacuolar-type H+-ATPase subunit H
LPQARDFLDRFRPAGAPGAASRAGVPADRAAELASELEPVLALLAGTDAECRRIIATAQREAEQIGERAREQAAAVAAEARRLARAAQDEAVEHALAAAHAEADEVQRSAAAQSGRGRAAFAEGPADRLAALAVELILALPDSGRAPVSEQVSERGTQ